MRFDPWAAGRIFRFGLTIPAMCNIEGYLNSFKS